MSDSLYNEVQLLKKAREDALDREISFRWLDFQETMKGFLAPVNYDMTEERWEFYMYASDGLSVHACNRAAERYIAEENAKEGRHQQMTYKSFFLKGICYNYYLCVVKLERVKCPE